MNCPASSVGKRLTALNEHDVSCSDELRNRSVEQLGQLQAMLSSVTGTVTPELEQNLDTEAEQLNQTYQDLHRLCSLRGRVPAK